MFEIGFTELALIFGVALLVLGPTRLPGLVSKIGRWVGKARSMARDFRQQLENEVNLEELNKMTDLQTKQARNEHHARANARVQRCATARERPHLSLFGTAERCGA